MAREHLLVVGLGGRGWNREKLPGHPNLFSKNYIYNTPETHTTNTLLENTDLKKKCKQNLKCCKTRMSAMNYECLVQPTIMEGKNSYGVVKCVIKCVIKTNEQCSRCVFPLLSPS